jgi:MFS family permease
VSDVAGIGAPPDDARPLLRQSAFQRVYLGRLATGMAFQMQAVAIGWQLYALTGNPYDLGLIGLAQFVPMFLLTLPAGHLADTLDRRRIIATCQVIGALTALALAMATATDTLTRTMVFGLVMAAAAARAFEFPTMTALLPQTVTRDQLQRATALYASANQTATVLGPAIGGIIYAAFGPVAVYALVATLALAAAACIATIRVATSQRRREPATLATVFAGVAFIARTRVLLGAISLDLVAVIVGAAVILLPVYARDILHTDAAGLGILRAAPAVGALAMSLVLARADLKQNIGLMLFAGVAMFGAATIVFGLSTSFYVSLAALAVLGASDMISVVIRISLVQLETPDEMRGRVAAVNALFINASNQLGDYRAGLIASVYGAVPAVIAGGVCAIAIAGLWMVLFPEIRKRQALVK